MPGHVGVGGRPKWTDEEREAMARLRELTPKAVATLADILDDPKAQLQTKVKCAELIMDRALGKPRQSVEVDVGEETRESVRMTLEEKLARIKEIAKEYRDDE